MTEFVVVLTTIGVGTDGDPAKTLAAALVERRVAACVNIVAGVQSIYRWEGAVQTDAEHLLIIKSTTALVPALERALIELHPYDTPEFVVLPIAAIGTAYGRWLGESVG